MKSAFYLNILVASLTVVALIGFSSHSIMAQEKQERHAPSHAEHSSPEHHAEPESSTPADLPQLNPEGKPWATTPSLREGMEHIRDEVTKAQQRPTENKKLSPESATSLADGVDSSIQYMLENCKLEPEVDKNLHVLLIRLIDAAKTVRENPDSEKGLPEMVEVLDAYPKYFDHPSWEMEH